MKKYRKIKYAIICTLSCVMITLILSVSVFATVPASLSTAAQNSALINARNKVIYTAFEHCYDSLSPTIDLSKNNLTWGVVFSGDGDSKRALPYYLFGDGATVKEKKELSCSQIMGGYVSLFKGDFVGIGYKQEDVPVGRDGFLETGDKTKEQMMNFLKKIGYTEKGGSSPDSGYKCVYYSGDLINDYGSTTYVAGKYQTDRVCARPSAENENLVDPNYNIKTNEFSLTNAGGYTMIRIGSGGVTYKDGVLTIPNLILKYWVGQDTATTNSVLISNALSCNSIYFDSWSMERSATCDKKKGYMVNVSSLTFEDLANALAGAISAADNGKSFYTGPAKGSLGYMAVDFVLEDNAKTIFKKGEIEPYMRYFLGDNYANYGRSLNDTEKYLMYRNGLLSVGVGARGVTEGNGNVINWLSGETFKTNWSTYLSCDKCKKISVLTSGQDDFVTLDAINADDKFDLSTVLGLINSLDYDSEDFGDVETPEEDLYPDIVRPSGSNESAQCYNGSGVVGWLVCPLIQMISGIGNSLWSSIEKSFMIIPAEIFNSDKGVRTAWDVIRNIGNVFFIILFMIVIFSQLTGVGIDNYGIKKILPKLILVAVLANLSWIICELVVDVSNIVGSGITGLLTNVASSIATPSGSSTAALVTGGVGDFALAGGGAALFVLLNGWNLAGLAALGLAVLGVVISLVSGIIVMYVILIVRQAGVILLIALSPLAIVCYALPNTEKMFKRWKDLFKALLVVYPLCGAALGAGKLASAVLASIAGGDSSGLLMEVSAAISAGDLGKFTSIVFAADNVGNTGLMLAAMIVQVLPFFLIPKLLKNSLALMGNIGEKISRTGRSLGRRASGTLQSGVKNSNRFKDFQQYQSNQTALRRAKRTHNRYTDGNGEALAGLSKRQKDRLAKANAIMAADSAREKKTDLDSSKLGFETNLSHQELAYSSEKEKMLAERYANDSREENENELKGALDGDDAERAAALTKTVLDQGGEYQVLDALMKNDKWLTNPNMKKRMMMVFGSSKLDALKSYYKYLSTGGKASFKEWMSGDGDILTQERASNAAGSTHIKDLSYADHLSDMGVHAMDSYTKDEMQFVEKHASELSKRLGADTFGQMVGSFAVNSRDAKAKTVGERIARNEIANGTMSGENLGLTPADIGNMRDEMADAIYDGYRIKKAREMAGASVLDESGNFSEEKFNALDDGMKKSIESAATADMRKSFSKQIDAINKDNRIRNKMRSGVKDRFGIVEEGMAGGGAGGRSGAGGVGGGAGGRSGAGGGHVIEVVENEGHGARQGSRYGDGSNIDGGGAVDGGGASKPVIEAAGSHERPISFDVPEADVVERLNHSTYDKEKSSGGLPDWVETEDDYKPYRMGMEASRELSLLQNKTLEQARSEKKVALPLEATASDDAFKNYQNKLRSRVRAMDDLKLYHEIKNLDYEGARGAKVQLPSAVNDAQNYREFKGDLVEKVRKMRAGESGGGRIDIPR